MSRRRRLRCTPGVERCDVNNVLVCARGLHAGFSAHPALFPDPPIPVATLAIQIAGLDAAQQTARYTRATGTVALRDLARDVLWTSVEACCTFVQGRIDANPEQGHVLIEKSGLRAVAFRSSSKPPIEARLEPQGAVLLRAHSQLLHKGRVNRTFDWQYTLDGGQTWIDVPSTPVATTRIAGLPALATCGFRVRVTLKTGASEWSQPVSLLVHA